jgi:hypothetical protein
MMNRSPVRASRSATTYGHPSLVFRRIDQGTRSRMAATVVGGVQRCPRKIGINRRK